MRPKRKTDSYKILHESYYGDLMRVGTLTEENHSKKHSLVKLNTLKSIDNNQEKALGDYINGLNSLEIRKKAKFDFSQIQ